VPDEPALAERFHPRADGRGPLPPGEPEAAAMGREGRMVQPRGLGLGGEEHRAPSRLAGAPSRAVAVPRGLAS